jgi:hypothetical protein
VNNKPRLPAWESGNSGHRKGLMRRIATLLVLAFALMAPASALANSTCSAYNRQTCTVPPNDGQLPFTGLDVVLLVAGGAALLGAGFVVRRVSRNLS